MSRTLSVGPKLSFPRLCIPERSRRRVTFRVRSFAPAYLRKWGSPTEYSFSAGVEKKKLKKNEVRLLLASTAFADLLMHSFFFSFFFLWLPWATPKAKNVSSVKPPLWALPVECGGPQTPHRRQGLVVTRHLLNSPYCHRFIHRRHTAWRPRFLITPRSTSELINPASGAQKTVLIMAALSTRSPP